MKEIKYTPALDSKIRNIGALPFGRGSKYLVCITGEGGDLIAKQWKRKKPAHLSAIEVLIVFGN